MGSGLSKVDMWNGALDLLREQPLSSADDSNAPARWLRRNYDQQRDYVLGRYYWKFAMDRVELPADVVKPAWGWAKRYTLPADLLRLVPPTINGEWDGTPIPFEQESGYLLCDVDGPLRLRFVARVTNEGLFSNDFCEVMQLRLAMRMAHWITGKQSMVAELREMYRVTIDEARDAGAVQVAAQTYYDDDILTDRMMVP